MLKQHRSDETAPKLISALSAACLSAFLVFGNAASAFGNAAASANPRAKTTASKAPETNKRKETSDDTGDDTKNDATPDDATKTAKTTTRKPAFTKVGDPFLVATADAPQTQTSPRTPPGTQSQTPAQTDATRPPGTEQNQSVPPTARTNPPANPQTPPGTQQPVPQSPPGVQAPTTNQPPGTTAPNPSPTGQTATPTTEMPTTDQTIQEPNFPTVQQRPVPPLPSLERVGVISSDTLPLSMNEAIRRALENNNDIESSRADVRIAEQQLIALQGVYDPVFLYAPEVNNSVRPVVNIFGGAGTTGTVSTTDYNNNFSVTKQFGKGGGNYSYFFNNTRENSSATNTTLNPFYSAAQGLQFTQPLWRNRSIDSNRQQIRIQRKRLEQSDADFRRITTQTISQVQSAYWDLVFAIRNEQNQVANVNLAREDFKRTEASVAAGASAPLARAEIETELSTRESALLIANQQVTTSENVLKQLLIKDPLSPDWQKVITPTDQPTFDEAAPVNLDSALKEARENRPELRRLQLEEDVNTINLQFYKNQTKPRIDLTGTIQTNGLAGTPDIGTVTSSTAPLILGDDFATTNASAFLLQQLNATRAALGLAAVTPPNVTTTSTAIPSQFVGGYGRTLSNLFSFSTRQVVVGATIQIPLKNRTAQANYATAQIQRDQLAAQTRSQAQIIEVDVRNAVQAVETARQRVLSARQARASAEEQLAGERRLFQVGRSTQFLLFQRENELVTAQAEELQAETDYNKALADLQRATSTTLRANNVVIDSPVPPEKFKN